jgi:ATP phosphoribosyltransferase regulatory subunit
MSSPLSRIPSGVQYIFDKEVRVRRWIERELMRVFDGWSYSEIILPMFDYADLFALGMGKEHAEKTYRFTGRDGKLLALRPEMTSLVARTVAARFRERPRPIRLSYSGEVFRWDEPHAGRQYEFHQTGLELIGSDRLEADSEVLVVAIEALRRIGLEGFTITLSHVDVFNGIVDRLELDPDQRVSLQEMIDRKQTGQLNSLLEPRLDQESREAFCSLTALAGGGAVLAEARALVSNAKSTAALDDIERVYQIAEALGIDAFVDIDLGDVGGLDYYTGLIFKIYAEGLGSALGRGGRYDRLLSKFGAAEPAVGFSLCLDWLAQLLPISVREAAARSDQGIRLSAGGNLVSAFKEANKLRSEGRKVEMSSDGER